MRALRERDETRGQGTVSRAPSPILRRLSPNPQHLVAARGRMIVALGALVAALVVVLFLGARYLTASQQGSAASLPALSAITSAASPHFLFSIHGISRPLGVAVSPAGDRIYVTESDGARETRVFDRDGKPLGVLNPPGSDPASRVPVYVAAAHDGRVYVSDRRAGTIHIYSPTGEHVGEVPPPEGAGSSWSPLALAFDGQGNLLVTEASPGRHGVTVLGPEGALLRRFGREGTAPGEFSYPNGVAADRTGRLLVSDSNNGRMVVLDGSGSPLWAFGRTGVGSSLGLPRGLVVDGRNRAYVADTVNHDVLVFDVGEREARLLFTLGEQGIKDGEFVFPNGLAWDSGDRLYITDRENNRVQVWTY